MLFEGFLHEGAQVCVKAKEEAKLWFVAQGLNEMGEDRGSNEVNLRNEGWQRPPVDVVKCNIGMEWSQKRRIMGAAWILRDSNYFIVGGLLDQLGQKTRLFFFEYSVGVGKHDESWVFQSSLCL